MKQKIVNPRRFSMLALIKYGYDYYEWEMVIAVSKEKEN